MNNYGNKFLLKINKIGYFKYKIMINKIIVRFFILLKSLNILNYQIIKIEN